MGNGLKEINSVATNIVVTTAFLLYTEFYEEWLAQCTHMKPEVECWDKCYIAPQNHC